MIKSKRGEKDISGKHIMVLYQLLTTDRWIANSGHSYLFTSPSWWFRSVETRLWSILIGNITARRNDLWLGCSSCGRFGLACSLRVWEGKKAVGNVTRNLYVTLHPHESPLYFSLCPQNVLSEQWDQFPFGRASVLPSTWGYSLKFCILH